MGSLISKIMEPLFLPVKKLHHFSYYHQNHSIHLCAAEILRWIFATKTKETKEKNACLTLHIYSN